MNFVAITEAAFKQNTAILVESFTYSFYFLHFNQLNKKTDKRRTESSKPPPSFELSILISGR